MLICCLGEEVNGSTFLELEKEDLRAMGLKTGPILSLMRIVNDCKMTSHASHGNNVIVSYFRKLWCLKWEHVDVSPLAVGNGQTDSQNDTSQAAEQVPSKGQLDVQATGNSNETEVLSIVE